MKNQISASSCKNPYPLNLLTDVLDITEFEIPEITKDIVSGLEYASSLLGERRNEILKMFYKEGLSVPRIAEFFNVSKSAIYTLKRNAIMRLRRPKCICYLIYGKEGFEQRERKQLLDMQTKRDSIEYKEIMKIRFEELDLSVRSFNCLRRAGFIMIGDIVDLTEDEIIHIKNISWKQYDEIGRALLAKGVTESTWLDFIDKSHSF